MNPIRQVVLGRIRHAPRRLIPYLKSLVRKLTEATDLVQRSISTLSKDEENVRDWLNSSTNYEVGLGELETFADRVKHVQGRIGNITSSIQSIEEDVLEIRRAVDFINDSLGWMWNDLEPWTDRILRIDGHISTLREEAPYYDEMVPGAVELVASFPNSMRTIQALLSDAREKLGELMEATKPRFEEEYRPEHGKVETLYHATTNARELVRDGFSLDWKGEPTGVGGATSLAEGQPGISFASDLYIAKEIARVFKELKMIADGEVQTRHIMEWAERERIADKVKKSVRGLYGKDAHKARTPGELFDVYRSYLAYSKRYDPVLFQGDSEGFMRRFKRVKRRDIGILVVDVDMSHPDIMYFGAEREFRVPPESVIQIKRVIQ